MSPALELGEIELQRVADTYHHRSGRIERSDRMPDAFEPAFESTRCTTAEDRHETEVAMRREDDTGSILLCEVPAAAEHVSTVASIGSERGAEMRVEPFEAAHSDPFER